jgi:hypothetical protein
MQPSVVGGNDSSQNYYKDLPHPNEVVLPLASRVATCEAFHEIVHGTSALAKGLEAMFK